MDEIYLLTALYIVMFSAHFNLPDVLTSYKLRAQVVEFFIV